MTNELAIRILTGDVLGTSEQTQEAVTMAVRALSQPEPCEDAVSREAVSSWLKQYGQDVLHGKMKFSLMYIWKNLMDLPSAQPEITHCNSCKHWTQSTGKMKGYGLGRCDFHDADLVTCNGFCYWAERRNDE